jgi:hypothetical protein
VTWFERDIVRLLPGGRVEHLIDIDLAQPAAERLYEKLRALLRVEGR